MLCIGAHSDDIEIGCGGALLELVDRRPDVTIDWVVLSGSGDRAMEARLSAAAWAPTAQVRVTLAEFRDGYFPAQFEAVKDFVQRLAARVCPDVVFTHFRDDRHQDHRTVSDLTWNAFRDHVILEYEVPKWDGDLAVPNVYVPLSAATAERKLRLLLEHFGSQRSKDWFTQDTFAALLRLRGLECRSASGLAEGFHARKMILSW